MDSHANHERVSTVLSVSDVELAGVVAMDAEK